MRSVVHHAQDGIITFNAKGLIESFNPAAERLFRYDKEKVIGRPIRTLFDSSSPALDLKANTRQELRGKCSDGFLFPIELTLSGFEVEGEPFHTTILRDITKQKQIEEELAKARDHALESARLKSEFINNMSHEMRTPMNGIIGMTELALDTALSAEQRDYLSAVKYSADSMLAVIDDVLDFSELEAGKLELSPISFKLRDSLGETVRIVEFRARQKGLE